ncbi:subtilisin [Rhodopirellula europaea 6C]|uniref:Subtilisin n=2 Tax=Rhodopirellula TaxID=265488 RepID=M2AET7_9BACT|nr:subtilisin [Rhodopirellula europaea 6C]
MHHLQSANPFQSLSELGKMKNKRRWLIETLEQRVVLDAAGPIDDRPVPAMESVIVTFAPEVANPNAVAKGLVKAHGGQLGHVYENALKGFSAQLPQAARDALARNPRIERVEADLVMQAFAQVTPTGIDRIDADVSLLANIDNVDDRVDVNIAIIDSGIDTSHPDLNVAGGTHFYTVTSGRRQNRGSFQDNNFNDDNGHGTHVAGTAAALDNNIGVVGVAPGANLFGVKVLDASGSGYLSDIIKGIDWVTSTRTDPDPTNDIHVANMSLGGQGVSQAYHQAIKNSVSEGVVYVVASGNEYRDILGTDFQFGTFDDTIPAAYPEVAAISAIADTDGMPGGHGPSTQYADYFGNYADDEFADFSNFSNDQGAPNYSSWYDSNNVVDSPGLGIDLMLPGVDIYSTYKDGGYALSSGTSMATPHAAGLAALYIAANGPAEDAAGVYAIRQAMIDGGKAWTSPEGLQLPSPPTPNPDSPDNHVENLGWAEGGVPNELPIADAGISQSGIEDSEIVFDASASYDPDGGSLTFVWDFGDGHTAQTTSPTISHIYLHGGSFSVSLTVTDDRGGQANDSTSADVAEVNDAPVANAGGPYQGYIDAPISFDASASVDFDNVDGTTTNDQELTYTWDFGDGVVMTTTDATVDHSYSSIDSFNVSLSINDGFTDSATAVTSVVVDQEQLETAMYVSSIDFESRRRGRDWRSVVQIRSAQDDSVLTGVTVTVIFAGEAFQGTTDSNGLFRTGWIRNLSSETHFADVTDLALANYAWDPLSLDTEEDNGGLLGFPDGTLDLN